MTKLKKTHLIILALVAISIWWWGRSQQDVPNEADRMTHVQQPTKEKIPARQIASTSTGSFVSEANPQTTSKLDVKILTAEEVQQLRTKIKINMSQVYTAQMSMFADHHRYTTDLKYTGYMPEWPLAFKVGFLTSYHPDELLKNESPDEALDSDGLYAARDIDQNSNEDYQATATSIDLQKLQRYCDKGCTATQKGFEVLAAANLDADETLDVWVINDQKKIIHKVDDLKE